MLSLYDYQRTPKRLADRLPWFALVAETPCVVRHKDGSLQHCLKFQGRDVDAVPLAELKGQAAQLNNVCKRFGGGWAVFVEYAKRQVHAYADAEWPNAASAAFDAERRQHFLHTPHFTLESVLSLVWRPVAVLENKVRRYVMTSDGAPSDVDDDVATFQDQVTRFTDLFAGCMAWVEPMGPASTLAYLHAGISTAAHPVAVPDLPAYLDYHLADRDFVPGMQPALIIGAQAQPRGKRWQDRYQAHHLRTLTVSGFPNDTYPEMLAALTELPLEYRYVIRWLPLDTVDAYKLMKSKASLWKQMKLSWKQYIAKQTMPNQVDQDAFEPDREATANKESLDAAMDDCFSRAVSFGYWTATVTVWHAQERQADANLREVEKVITGKGFSCHPEHLNAVEAWMGSLPGHCYANVRQPLLSSMNLVHSLVGGVYTGPARDEHMQAPAVMRVTTAGNLPYNLVLHEDGIGHTLVIGPSGAGKTTFVGAVAAQFQRYHTQEARVRLIDKKEGLKPVTGAMDGDHYTLGGDGTGVAFQPLRDIDQLAERQWAAAWVESLCEAQHVPCTPPQRRELWDALTSLAALPVRHRTLTGLQTLVQDVPLRQGLHQFTLAGAYGRVLDAVTEPLALQPWSCFETDALFGVAPLVAPTLGVLFHQLGRTFLQRRPTLFVLDEAWRYLAHMTFRDQIEEWLRELRKLNVSIVFSTQDLNELLQSPIATVLLNNCPIRVFLPNKRATEPQIAASYAAVDLNARQRDILSAALPHRDYLVMTRDGCRLVDLALGPVQQTILTQGRIPA